MVRAGYVSLSKRIFEMLDKDRKGKLFLTGIFVKVAYNLYN